MLVITLATQNIVSYFQFIITAIGESLNFRSLLGFSSKILKTANSDFSYGSPPSPAAELSLKVLDPSQKPLSQVPPKCNFGSKETGTLKGYRVLK